MATQDQSIPTILETLRTQIETEDFEAANNTFDTLSTAYSEQEQTEQLLFGKARTRRTTEDLSVDVRDNLFAFERQFIATQMGRIAILTGGATYLSAPTQADGSEFVSTLSTQVGHEEELQSESESVTDELADVSVPPSLNAVTASITDVGILVGESTSASMTVQNVGTNPATGVTVTVSGDGFSVSPATHTVGELPGEEATTVTSSVTSSSAGSYEIEFHADSENAGSASRAVQVEFQTAEDVLTRQQETLEELKSQVDAVSLPGNSGRDLKAKLDAANDSIDRALQSMGSPGGQPPVKALNTAMNQLGAFLNQVDAIADRHLSSAIATTLTLSAEGVISNLARVRESF